MAFSTNYPPYNFHSSMWNIRERRSFFPDCGSFCGLHIDENGKATVQKEHNSWKREHIYAKFSTLPLFEKPKILQEHDAIGIYEMKYINKKMSNLHQRITYMNTICHKDKYWQNYMLDILKSIYAFEEGKECETKALYMFSLDTYLRHFYEELGNYLDVRNIWHSNHKFIGGCLQPLNFSSQADSTISLAAITGPGFNTIKIIKPQMKDSGLLTIDEKFVHEIKMDGEIFDLSCQTLYETTYCLSRGNNKCFLYEINSNIDEEGISSSLKNVLHFEGKTVTSINLSPYILGECLVADHTSSVFLCDENKSIQNVVAEHPHRFPCTSNWCQVHYASHPRSFVLTNQSTMELMDIRSSCKKPRDMFVLPNKYLSKNERISTSCCSSTNPFHHFVATNHGLFLLDERFLSHPVLQWQHMLEGIPHYLSPIHGAVQSSSDEVLLTASQYPNEVVCLQYRTHHNHPPISTCSPWRISKPGDLFYIEKLIDQVRSDAVHDRLSDPIVGVAGKALNSGGMYVFQLNSLGDIFYQAYGVTNKYEDKTCSAGPGDNIVKHSEEVVNISKNWLKHLENQLENKCSQAKMQQPTYDLRSIFQSSKGHVLCHLCMPQCHNSDIDSDDDEIISGLCNSCHTSLLSSKHLVSAIKVDGITKSSSGTSYDATPPSFDHLKDENRKLSKKLYKDWYEVELSSDDDDHEVDVDAVDVGDVDAVDVGDDGSDVEMKSQDNRDDASDSSKSFPKETALSNTVEWSGSESACGNDSTVNTEFDKVFGTQQTQHVASPPTHLKSLSQQTISSTVLQESDKHKTESIKLANSQPLIPINSQTLDPNSMSPALSQVLHSNDILQRKKLHMHTTSRLKLSTRSKINQFEAGFERSPTHLKVRQPLEIFPKRKISLFSQEFKTPSNINSSLLRYASQSVKPNQKQKYQEGF